MVSLPRSAIAAALFTLISSCNHDRVTVHSDSGMHNLDSLSSDSTNGDLILESSEVRTLSGDSIRLEKGEWYARAEYVDHDLERNLLIFVQDNGTTREIISYPWNRNGKMQLTADRDIHLVRGREYELIYYYQFDNPGLKSDMASGFYLTDITPAGNYFISGKRYQCQIRNTPMNLPGNSFGKFLDDLNGGSISIKPERNGIILNYNTSQRAETVKMTTEKVTTSVVKTELPDGTPAFFRFHDGEWILTDMEGTRRVYRPEDSKAK